MIELQVFYDPEGGRDDPAPGRRLFGSEAAEARVEAHRLALLQWSL
jgi:hypothetical protein